MDARQLFDTLARQEQPPMSVEVGRAIAAGRATRRRRRAGAAAVSALSVSLAVTVTWLGLPQLGQRGEIAVAVPTGIASTRAPAAPTAEPSNVRFRKMKKKYPPVGRIVSMPEIPLWMWLGRPVAGRKSLVLCNTWKSDGTGCAGFPPLTAKEFARRQGWTLGILDAKQMRALHPDADAKQLRRLLDQQKPVEVLPKIAFGIARIEVHEITAITTDGREIPGRVARSVGAGLGVWAVRFPSDVTTATLVFTDANGKTLQRIRHG
jgi:hypothetical protein